MQIEKKSSRSMSDTNEVKVESVEPDLTTTQADGPAPLPGVRQRNIRTSKMDDEQNELDYEEEDEMAATKGNAETNRRVR